MMRDHVQSGVTRVAYVMFAITAAVTFAAGVVGLAWLVRVGWELGK